MTTVLVWFGRWRQVSQRRWSVVLGAAVALAWATAPAFAQTVVRVEEDWRVEVGSPAADTSAPQIVTVISPSSNLNGPHAVFELNHSTMPEYVPGGLQLQRWNGETVADFHAFPNSSVMSTTGEVVTYTTKMSISSGKLWFEIVDGTSTTWGSFGGQGYLKVGVDSSLTDLSGYSPATSTKFSRIGFASNRVNKLVLTEVRYYAADGTLVQTDTTDRVVHSLDSN